MLFRNEYAFLSNFYPCSVKLNFDGRMLTFKNAEAAYQACKNFDRAPEFCGLDGKAAKYLGRRVTMRPDWDDVKITCMTVVLQAKFRQNPELMRKLKSVRENIVEENAWGDRYWGICRGTGENHLGKLLMELRDAG